MLDNRQNLRRGWIGLGWLLVICVIYLSLTPTPPQTMMSYGDKIVHLLAYAALMGWWHQIDRNACRLALLFILLGLSLEMLQGLGGLRQADIHDMSANTLGVGVGWILARFTRGWSARILAS